MLTVFGEASAQERVMQEGKRRVRPACEGCGIRSGGYSQGLQEALVDFGAHESYEKAEQRLARHYPVKVSDSTLRKITLKAGQKARAAQQREGAVGALPARGAECVEAQADGTMLPMLRFKPGIKDKRKARQSHWQELRLCVRRVQGTVRTRYACSMEGVEALGYAWAGLRVRIEHIYGHVENSMGGGGLEYIGLARIKTAVGLRNLAYNFVRYVQMISLGQIVHGKGWKKATA